MPPVYAVTGATGHLGRAAIAELLARGVPAEDIVAIVRDPAKASELAGSGVAVREGDYDRPETLPAALAGVQRLLLVSGSEVGRRVAQHRAVIDAAKAAGVDRIAYTSVLNADTNTAPVTPEHKATENVLAASGVPFTLLRNGWYVENYTSQLGQYLARGQILGAAGKGRVSAATRADYAAAAVSALTSDSPSAVYELGGGAPFSYDELASTISEVTGTPVSYQDVSADDFAAVLRSSGLEPGVARFVAGLDEAVAQGHLETRSDDLERLLGRPATPLADAVRAAG